MAFVLADRVRDTTTTTGTGTVTLSGTAPTGYQTFGDGIGNGNNTYYTINADSQWEVGIGTYTASGTTLARNTVLASSNGGALVDFALGVKDVFVTYPAEKAVTDIYGTALAATTAANIAGGAAGSIPYQTAANTTAMLATGTGVLIGGTTPSYTASPSLTQVTVAGDPSTALQVATKQYVDGLVSSGITYHEPVKYEVPNSTGNLNALYNQPGGAGDGVGATLTNNGTKAAFAPDGPTASVGDRILVYNQTSAFQNGIYTVTTVGTPDPGGTNWVLTRATDADTYGIKDVEALGNGDSFFVTSGDTGAGETYVCNTTGTITFGTTAITFVQVSDATLYTAGNGLQLTSGTVFSLIAPVTTVNGGTGLTAFTSGGAVYATSSSTLTTGTLPATAGGTGQSSYTAGDLVYATSATTLGVIADVATGNALISGGAGADPSYGKIGLTTHISGTLAVGNGGTGATTLTGYLVGNGTSAFTATATIPTSALSGTISLTTQVSGTLGAGNGGTGISSYTVGDILYASGTTTLSSLADVATGNALISGGVSNAPLWGKIGLTTHVSGTLPVSNGGSGATTLTGYLKGNGTSAFTASATIPSGDITGAALTKADDTNVTLTLGGSPSTALLAATSITAGWTGQLAVSRGGTGNATLTSNYLLKGNGVSPVAASIIFDNGTNVGIGTASPASRLQIAEANRADSTNIANVGIYTTTTQSTGVGGTLALGGLFNGSDLAPFGSIRGGKQNSTSGNYDGYLAFQTIANGGVLTEKMRIDSAGNVIIGGTSANSKLDVNGDLTLRNGSGVTIGFAYNNSGWMDFAGSANVNGAQVSHPGTVRFLTASTERMRIDSSGNVGIGRGDPPAALSIWRNSSTASVAATSSIVLTNKNTAINGTIMGGIFADTYRDVADPHYSGGIWFTRNQTSGNLASSSDIVFGAMENNSTSALPSERMRISATGPVTASVDMRAPIFYDSNNTAYYVDPAGGSRLGGQVLFDGGTVIQGNGDVYSRRSSGTTGVYYFADGGSKYLFWDGGAYFFGSAGYTQSDVSMRAPIFYDSNDTGFYVDPATTSVLNQAQFKNRIAIGDGNGTPFLNAGSPGVWLSYNGGVNIFMGSESSTVAGFYIAGDWRLRVNSSGDVTAGGNVTAYSDARLKKDVVTIDNALGLVGKMRGVTYTRKDTGEAGVGVIAQEMLEVMPQAVHQGTGDNDTLSVAYGNLVGVLIEAIKELTARVAELEGK
jgi:hypothetical protein